LEDSLRKLNELLINKNVSEKDTTNNTNEIDSDTIKKEISFKDFAKDFITNGTKDYNSFKNYSEEYLLTFDYETERNIEEKSSESHEFLIYYFKNGKYSIGNSIITYKVPYMPDVDKWVKLYFRKNSDGVYKLYKYEAIS